MLTWPDSTAQLAFARKHWQDAGKLDDDVVIDLLDAALPGVLEYAPPLDGEAPTHYQLALVFHARELRNAMLRGEADVVGVGDYALRARPLTAAVKSLLRPQRGRPGIG